MESKPIYKTAKELGIKPWERNGLIALVGVLDSGDLFEYFNMRGDGCSHGCGSVFCIGGHVAAARGYSNDRIFDYVRRSCSPALWPLYYPGGAKKDAEGLLRGENKDHLGWIAYDSMAVRAILNFLTLGDPKWDVVVAR